MLSEKSQTRRNTAFFSHMGKLDLKKKMVVNINGGLLRGGSSRKWEWQKRESSRI
jgi:hypothetical protein